MSLNLPGMLCTARRRHHARHRSQHASLAETRNLVPGARKPLTEAEWTSVINRYKSRTHCSMECPICCEPFRQEGKQVLLSCSHSFHQQCLSSFEMFTTTQTGHSCPVCRMRHYEKKMISDGHKEYLNSCAVVIQSNWRRCQAVERFNSLWEQAPAPPVGDLRAKWALNRLGQQSDKLLRAMNDEVGDLDRFFRELAQETEACNPDVSHGSSTETSARGCEIKARVLKDEFPDVDWKAAYRKAKLRGLEDCSICMMPLTKRWRNSSQCSLLSCSHRFHTQCIAAFEVFQADRGAGQSCPVCREHYQRKQLKQ